MAVKRIFSIVLVACFLLQTVLPAGAQGVLLPQPGTIVNLSPAVEPPVLRGVKVYADQPFRFDFILDKGSQESVGAGFKPARNGSTGGSETRPYDRLEPVGEGFQPSRSAVSGKQPDLNIEATKLIRYFLASLTVPEGDLWVNLSPYEKDRIIPDAFGQTEMGRDILAQDYILKQLTASVIYPESDTGKKFWAEVYKQAFEKYGTTDIPVDTFNKVWIVPAKAEVYEKAQSVGAVHEPSGANSSVAYVVDAKLKVMLETDYLATSKNPMQALERSERSRDVGAQFIAPGDMAITPGAMNRAPTKVDTNAIFRNIIIPILEKEVNEGANFAQLRQVYYSLILAAWYKRRVKDSLLNAVYADKKKMAGININDPQMAAGIWGQYVEAFKKGAYNYVKEEKDALSGEVIPRKYFSGGIDFAQMPIALSVSGASPSWLIKVMNRVKEWAYGNPSRLEKIRAQLQEGGDRNETVDAQKNLPKKRIMYLFEVADRSKEHGLKVMDVRGPLASALAELNEWREVIFGAEQPFFAVIHREIQTVYSALAKIKEDMDENDKVARDAYRKYYEGDGREDFGVRIPKRDKAVNGWVKTVREIPAQILNMRTLRMLVRKSLEAQISRESREIMDIQTALKQQEDPEQQNELEWLQKDLTGLKSHLEGLDRSFNVIEELLGQVVERLESRIQLAKDESPLTVTSFKNALGLLPDSPWVALDLVVPGIEETPVLGNTVSLADILYNITTNTKKAAIRAHKNPKMTIRMHREGNDLVVIFEDNGTGFSDEALQIDENTGRKRVFTLDFTTGGTGLGMSEIETVIGSMHGTVDAENIYEPKDKGPVRKKIGARVSLRVPVAVADETRAEMQGSVEETGSLPLAKEVKPLARVPVHVIEEFRRDVEAIKRKGFKIIWTDSLEKDVVLRSTPNVIEGLFSNALVAAKEAVDAWGGDEIRIESKKVDGKIVFVISYSGRYAVSNGMDHFRICQMLTRKGDVTFAVADLTENDHHAQQITIELPDAAMALESKANGGIDLNPVDSAMKVNVGAGEAMRFHVDPALLERSQRAPGFVAVITAVEPLASLPDFLELPSPNSP